MSDLPDALPADYDPAHVFRVVAMPVSQGWGVWLRAADDSIIHSFGLGFPPGTPFQPDVLDVLGPLLNVQYRLAFHGPQSWDELGDHWSAVVYEYNTRASRSRPASSPPLSEIRPLASEMRCVSPLIPIRTAVHRTCEPLLPTQAGRDIRREWPDGS